MTTLHRVAEASKKIIIGFAIGIGSIIFIAVLFRVFSNIKEALFPTPPPPPTVRFGKLPAVPFPQSATDKALTYSLNTLTGSLPDLPAQIYVYKIFQPTPSLLGFDNVKTLAAKNNFTSDPVAVSDTTYTWENADPIGSTLTYNIITGDFDIKSDYLTNQDVLSAANLPQPQDAISFAKEFLSNFSAYPSDIDDSKTTTRLFTITNGGITSSSSFSNAQLIEVDYFQNDVDKIPIYYPHYPSSLMHVVLASANGQDTTPQVVEASFYHKIVQTENGSTYPLISSKDAFDLLKTNKAYIANYEGTNTNINISSVSLGYFLGTKPQSFLYPVIIFQGDNNFYAFVSAVKDEWVKN